MEGARQDFLSAGFDGASMNDIARVAGVSKGTLYAYFNSKDDLFEEIIRAEKGQAAERLCTFLPDYSDPRATLTDFGVRLLTRMAEPSTLALSRVVIAAAGKFPNIGRVFFEAGPLHGNQRLAERLRSLEQAGLIRAPDPSEPLGIFSTSASAASIRNSCSALSTRSALRTSKLRSRPESMFS
jgi:AcrR family transcriptional regulator